MSKLTLSILATLTGNVFAWFQLQGQFLKYEWMKSPIYILLMGMPIAYLFWLATKLSYEHFGQFWNIRLMGFGLGTIMFGIMTWAILQEAPTLKTIISLLLAAAIVLIQVTNVVE